MPTGHALPADSLIIERYRIIERVGGGAMAQVYRVEDMQTGAIHALKALRIPAAEDGIAQNDFIKTANREALFLKKLSHPALPRYEDLFSDAHYVYLLMEFIEGDNLKIYLEQDEMRTLDIRMIVHWGVQICDTLTYLHHREPPIVFRDLKPSNLIRRPDDRICLVDFGIARYASKKNATDTIVLGSPGYAPPEQYGQGQTGPRSDIYALGATLHHLITGRDPSIAPFKWPAVRSLNPLIPRPLDNLIMKCVALDTEKRPESAEKVGTALRDILKMLDEANGPIYAITTAPQTESLTGKLDRSAAPTRHLDTLEEDAPPAAPQALNEASSTGSTGSTGLTVRGALRPPSRTQYAQPHYAPSRKAPLWENKEILRRILLAGALLAIFGSVGLAMLGVAFEQSALMPLRFLLTALACVGFVLGAVRSERPGRQQLLIYLGATLCLFLLTALTLLPAYPGLCVLFLLLEAPLTAPALLLLAAGPSRLQ